MGRLRQVIATLVAIFVAFATSAMAVAQSRQATKNEPYHIGVWYFSRWNNSIVTPQAVKEGRTDVWAGVRDFATGHGSFPVIDRQTGRPTDYRDREPLLGFYDQMSQSVIEAHVREAASAGIEYFAFYWYIDADSGHERPISAPIRKFFGLPQSEMKFVLAPILLPSNKPMSLSTWVNTVIPQIVAYMELPSYFRIENRPLFVDFSVPLADSERREAYRQLRSAVQAKTGVDPIILSFIPSKANYTDIRRRITDTGADGVTCFNVGSQRRQEEPYEELIQFWREAVTRHITRPDGTTDRAMIYVPCGTTGIDSRPWYGARAGWTHYQGRQGPESRPYVVGVTPKNFQRHLIDIRSLIDLGKVRTLRTAIIYAWNEWGEAAASIEPSKMKGYEYADAIKEVFGLVPRSPRP